MAMHSDKIEYRTVPAICLAHLSIGSRGLRRNSLCMRSSTTFYNRFTWVSVERIADRERSRRPPRNSLHAHLWRISKVASGWLFEPFFAGSVLKLHQANLLDTTVIHGDGTTTSAKKGGDNIGFSGHKKVKGDKIVAFCDRHCNVIAPFVSAPGNRNESPLLRSPSIGDAHRQRSWP